MKSINPLRRFQKGSILVHILHHAEKEPLYGVWLKEELMKHGYNISDGTLYPWLNRLESSGFLSMNKKNIDGKIRKYYSITEAGEVHLRKIKKYLKELYREVMES